ncbi:3-oxoacyl-[acyl-carrier-protein] synthase III C-terminal domain-containing protein [Mycolicibacterium sp. 120270]|uniref:3-oxoacyl-[acyl-carrier-protein] synthase III C-terminal domain-containing protein n=1 Tax=Mycolicibacterium sp. 120270 TaxID=3090600 RepID=UPI00299DE3B2|nr:3-oxoacyl-[acyl-carrier-protein] synthase III C-terminal domain-containing protein [Mycolicibacterium sp. 120270]MDX1886021.1 3-oxoacyl-[acyl-carrier-protein] synthase III C-terminal domain-containing protein [Mycolicibacterium sp. 120270]
MATVIERIELADGHWRDRHSALRLAVKAARGCIRNAGREPGDIDLLINAGIYRDRNLGEPALAAMIQEDIGAHPESPHPGSHGTFSFDVVNGSCSVLTALQVVDGFLRSQAIDCAVVVASDADPGRGMSERFPYSPAGGALLCTWADDDRGIGRAFWANSATGRETYSATVGMVDHRNILRVERSAEADDAFAEVATRAANRCLNAASMTVADIDAVVAAPAWPRYRAALAHGLGLGTEKIIVADDGRLHTVSLVAALSTAQANLRPGAQVLLVAAGAGVTAGAALYRL